MKAASQFAEQLGKMGMKETDYVVSNGVQTSVQAQLDQHGRRIDRRRRGKEALQAKGCQRG